ncbi:hypothetical protein C8Q80DRAFT_1270854 [Daedaleopsis nitida]|nr:hypothetical protein C8Q80DRAFT_1270854 [Daedaleopsis nitida]
MANDSAAGASSDPGSSVLDQDSQRVNSSHPLSATNPESRINDIKTEHTEASITRKRPLSRSSSFGRDSLTPLSSSPAQKKKYIFPPTSNIAPRLARQFMRVQSQAISKTTSEFKPQPVTQSKSLDNLFAPLDSTDDESCDETDIGSFVWVSIDLTGKLTDCGEDSGEDTIWWPAKVELPKPMMRVTLYGHPPGMDIDRRLSISKPSASNIRPMMLDGRIRFNESNYRPARPEPLRSSPRKKRKLELVHEWQEARDLMVRANEDGDEALLFSFTRYASPHTNGKDSPGQLNGDTKGKAKAVTPGDFEDFNMDSIKSGRRWRAPSANMMYELPGELVLAREGKTRTQYWPAKLLEYIKPENPSQKPKYKVLFFDGTISDLEADWFWTTTDEQFATCKLGESTGNYGLDYDNDNWDELDDAEDFSRPFASENEATLRAPSPLPDLPPPQPSVFEYDFTIAEEFEWIKPVLAAVISNTYGPSRTRHEGFMRGGGIRQRILDSIPLRGSLNAKEKEELAFYVRCWARRRDRRHEMGLPVDYPADKMYAPVSRRRARAAKLANEHESDLDSALTPTSDLSVGDTELVAPSETDAPPSSLGPTEFGTDEEEMAVRQDLLGHELSGPEDAINASPTDEHPRAAEDVPAQFDDPDAMVTEDVKPIIANDHEAPRPPPRMSFYDLDALEKLTYCNNVLLQEAILQLLLWRTGHRRALGLLPPEEEQRLHDIALKEGEKTNWVHDIIRLRQAAEKTMLPSSKGKGKGKGNNAASAAGTRGRTRRGG